MTDSLPGNRHVTILVRLLLDEAGRLIQGEALDLEDQSLGRFRSWEELDRLLRRRWRAPG